MKFSQGRLSRRTLLGGGAAIAAAGGTAFALSAGGHAPRHVAADPRTLARGNGAEPDTLDPHKATGNWENNIIGDMFLGLMTENAAADPVPGAAESYSASEDGLTYTFRLREHSWSDGVPVTAQDYVYSFRRILDPKTAAQYASILYPIKNAQAVNGGQLPPEQLAVRALDDRTLEIEFHFQVPYIAQLMTHYSTYAVPRHVVEKYGNDWLRPENIVTNGPYTLKEWVANDHIELVKNPRFHDAANVKIERIVFYPTQDGSAAVKRFRGGGFDIVDDSVPPQLTQWLKRELPDELRLHSYILTQLVLFNVHHKPFDDPRVRAALSLAIDRGVVAEKILRGGEVPAFAMVPPGMADYPGKAHLGFKAWPKAKRIQRATALLAEAGFGARNPLAFAYNVQNTTEAKIVAVTLQEMWRDIGVDVQLVQSETQVHYNLLRSRNFDVAWMGWIADYRDAKNYLFLFQSSTKDLNFGDYNNPKFDSLVGRSDMERDPAVRSDLLEQAEQTLLDDAAVIPVYFGVTRDLVSTEVRGWISNNLNINRSRYLSLERDVPMT